jgi:hypothetical protein
MHGQMLHIRCVYILAHSDTYYMNMKKKMCVFYRPIFIAKSSPTYEWLTTGARHKLKYI